MMQNSIMFSIPELPEKPTSGYGAPKCLGKPRLMQGLRYFWALTILRTTQAIVGTTHHDLHHLRKQALAPYFSKSSVSRLEPLIQQKVERLCARLQEFQGTGRPVNLSDAFTCFSADVIGSYVFGTEYGFLDSPEFNPGWRVLMTV
jgi:cytochrome P450